MKLQHHIGGLQNLGPVNTETRVFVAPWEQRIFGIHTVMMAESTHLTKALPKYKLEEVPTTFKNTWTWASLRTGAEGMQPFEYFKYRYYEKWLGGITQFFVDQGYITAEELNAKIAEYEKNPGAPLPTKSNPRLTQQINDYLNLGDSGFSEPSEPVRFKAGDRVIVANPAEVEHTRLPGYLRDKPGVIALVYPGNFSYFLPTGDGIGEAMPVYQVAFDPQDLWGDGMYESNTVIYADLFDAYLRPIN